MSTAEEDWGKEFYPVALTPEKAAKVQEVRDTFAVTAASLQELLPPGPRRDRVRLLLGDLGVLAVKAVSHG